MYATFAPSLREAAVARFPHRTRRGERLMPARARAAAPVPTPPIRAVLRRRRARRPGAAPQVDPVQLAVRPSRLAAVRGDHPARRVRPDAPRAAAARTLRSADRRGRRPRRHGRRARQRFVPQDVDAARCARRAASLRADQHFRRSSWTSRCSRCVGASRAARSCRWRPTSRGWSRCRNSRCAREARRPARGLLPGLDHRQLHAREAVALLARIAGDRARRAAGGRRRHHAATRRCWCRPTPTGMGVTAAFNLNLLTRINREFDGNFSRRRSATRRARRRAAACGDAPGQRL